MKNLILAVAFCACAGAQARADDMWTCASDSAPYNFVVKGNALVPQKPNLFLARTDYQIIQNDADGLVAVGSFTTPRDAVPELNVIAILINKRTSAFDMIDGTSTMIRRRSPPSRICRARFGISATLARLVIAFNPGSGQPPVSGRINRDRDKSEKLLSVLPGRRGNGLDSLELS